MIKSSIIIAALLLLCACSSSNPKTESEQTANTNTVTAGTHAVFRWFDYQGDDAIFDTPLAADEFRNPILSGYHPDPSIVRTDDGYYMVNSTFGYFPGVPVFHSTDLVNWQQIGNAITRPEQMVFDGLPLNQAGIYAPAIEYKDGTFYIITTCIGCGHNFVVTATDPAGPWSNPIWMPHLEGIDPSIFFDDDGKTYVVHHAEPPVKRYPAHTALRVMQVDPVTFEALSDDVLLVDGGEPSPWNRDYHEGPHIHKYKGTYYLSAPGGGTGYYHQQLIYRSDNVFGPYEANPDNPVLTQFGLPDDRPNPVTATGHADMVEDSNGDWWAVFLGTRVYDLATPPQDPGNFHTGRETFMLPVSWRNGWPVILEKGQAVPYAVKKPALPAGKAPVRAMTGNFEEHETFNTPELEPQWLMMRTPHSRWWQTGTRGLTLEARPDQPGDRQQPSFIGRRLAHMNATFGTQVQFNPQSEDAEAGLLAIQTDHYFYSFGLSKNAKGAPVLRIRQKEGEADPAHGKILHEIPLAVASNASVYLQMHIDKSQLDFAYSTDGKTYDTVLQGADAKLLTSAAAGGFVGAVVGMYAYDGAATE